MESSLGSNDGELDGCVVGVFVGSDVGELDGIKVGELEGLVLRSGSETELEC